MRIDLQLSPGVDPWPRLVEATRVAEGNGFDAVWVFDHFLGTMIDGATTLEPFTLLGALAASTERIGLGSLVLNVANRSAAVIASGAASVQTISAGRFVLGLGAGASPTSRWAREHRLLDIPLAATLAERHERLHATLDEIDRLWNARARIGRADGDLATFPRPDPRPPIVLGVNSASLAEIAGTRCDGLNVRSNHERLDEILAAALEARDRAARGGDPWDASVWAHWDEGLLDPDHRDRRRWAELGVNRLILVWFHRVDISALARSTLQ